jgi:NTE family protein
MRIGLVLGGGGVLGGAWEIGALHALKQETGWDPRSADVFVGTSAGALMASILAAGTFPELDLIDATTRRADAFPLPLPGSIRLGLRGLRSAGARRWIMTVAGILPRGSLSTRPIERAVRLRVPAGWPPARQLWIVATDYRSGERVVFGRAGAPPAELSAAVAASCAIPGVYQPVEIGRRLFVDGGLYSADNLDLLAGTGIDLALCLNPMSSAGQGSAPQRLADRLMLLAERSAHRRLELEAQTLQASGMTVMVIEPEGQDLAAMGLNMMSRKRARLVMETAVRTVTDQLRTPANRALRRASLAPAS